MTAPQTSGLRIQREEFRTLLKVFLLSAFCILRSEVSVQAARVEIKEGRFYVDGAPFYVKAVGYAPWRPHQHPGVSYTGTNRRWTQMDFARIKAAHFNTIRTWSAMDPEDLALAKEYGLMVLQGIWLDPHQDFSDPHNQQSSLAEVQGVAEQSKPYDNLLGYILMTEPAPRAVLEAGLEETSQYFRKLQRAIQTVDPRPVSVDSWPPLALMPLPELDFVTFNLFAFWPKSLTHAMGLAGLTRWHVDHLASGRPFIVGETGGYAVSSTSQTAAGGFGGLSEYDQSLKDLESLRATVEGHADGSVLVSWIDTWHYPKDPDTHDNEPWEWDGLLGIATDSEKDMVGIPRLVLKDVTLYNRIIPVEPKANHSYPLLQPIPIQVQGSDDVVHVRYSLNDGDWTYLNASGHGGFQGFFKLPKLARNRQTLAFQALNAGETVLARKEVSFLAQVPAEQVTIESANKKEVLAFRVTVRGGDQKPLTQRKVQYGCFDPLDFGEHLGTATTDMNGTITFSCVPILPAPSRFVYVAAGTESPQHVRASDMRLFKIGR